MIDFCVRTVAGWVGAPPLMKRGRRSRCLCSNEQVSNRKVSAFAPALASPPPFESRPPRALFQHPSGAATHNSLVSSSSAVHSPQVSLHLSLHTIPAQDSSHMSSTCSRWIKVSLLSAQQTAPASSHPCVPS